MVSLEGWLGATTTTTVDLVIQGTATETVTVTCDGNDFTGSADTTVASGLVKIQVTGLTADTAYPYTISSPSSDDYVGSLKTFPSSGGVNLAYWSCANEYVQHFRAMENDDVRATIGLGDINYLDVAANRTDGIDPDVYRDQMIANYIKYPNVSKRIPMIYVPDDHDYDVNDLQWSEAIFEGAGGYPWAPSGVDFTDYALAVDAAVDGFKDVLQGNPVNSDASIDTGAFYFRFECGNIEVFVLSCVVWGDDPADAAGQHLVRDVQGASNEMLGAKQTAWLHARLSASTKTFKLILCPKVALWTTNTNADGWKGYETTRDTLLQAIHDNSSGWTVPGGVMWGSGDYHSPSITVATEAAEGYDHVEVNAGPAREGTSPFIRAAGTANSVTKYSIPDELTVRDVIYDGLYGLVESTNEYMKISIRNTVNYTVASAKVLAGQHTLAEDVFINTEVINWQTRGRV